MQWNNCIHHASCTVIIKNIKEPYELKGLITETDVVK
jgi:hypothetical protein